MPHARPMVLTLCALALAACTGDDAAPETGATPSPVATPTEAATPAEATPTPTQTAEAEAERDVPADTPDEVADLDAAASHLEGWDEMPPDRAEITERLPEQADTFDPYKLLPLRPEPDGPECGPPHPDWTPVAGCAEIAGSGGTFYVFTDAHNAPSSQAQRPVATCRWRDDETDPDDPIHAQSLYPWDTDLEITSSRWRLATSSGEPAALATLHTPAGTAHEVVTQDAGRTCPEVAAALPRGPQVTAEVVDDGVRVMVPDLADGEPADTGDVHCVYRAAERRWQRATFANRDLEDPPQCDVDALRQATSS